VIRDDRVTIEGAKPPAKASVNFRFWDYLNGLLMADLG
jgi:hypothetical protein